MATKSIARFKQANGIQDEYTDPGNYVAVNFDFNGTLQTGQDGTFADLGRVLTQRFERQKDNIDFNDLQRILNIRGGVAYLNSNTGGSFSAFVILLFSPETVASALNILDGDEFNVEWQPGDDGTVFSDLTLEISGETANFPELGKLNYTRKTESYADSAAADLVKLNKQNVQALYVEDVNDNIDLIQVDNNQGSVVDSVPYSLLRGKTLAYNSVEDTTFDFAKVPYATPGSIAYNQANTVTLTIGAGGGDVGLITASWEDS